MAMAMRLYLLAALLLLMLSLTAAASDDPSGSWNILYNVWFGSSDDRLSGGSSASIARAGSTLHGEASLGNRSDGSLIGLSNGSNFDATITFPQKPAVFMRLKGDRKGDNLWGSFTASSSDGCFWKGGFTASPSAGGANPPDKRVRIDPVDYMTQDVTVVPEPTIFVDPEAFCYEQNKQTDKAKRDKFVIKYAKNTILMCRNKPMLWQWWP